MSCANRFALDNCIKCTICAAHCPVARVSDKFAGPKQNGPDLERFRLEGMVAAHSTVMFCSNCKNCDVACPSGVNISAMICRAKGELVAQEGAALRDRLMARVELLGKIGRMSPALVNWCGRNRSIRWIGEKIFGVSAEMTMPRYAGKTFYELYNNKRPAPGRRNVLYYPGCYVNYNAPEVGMALVKVMAINGVQVLVDKFNCCGLPMISNGLLDKAQKYVEKNIQHLSKYLDLGYQIITSCPSCNLTLRREYRELFGGIGDTNQLDDNIIDVFEYLHTMVQQDELNTNIHSLPLKVGYHLPCHLKAGGCGVPSRGILGSIEGLRLYDLDAGCCGLSGSCGFKREKYPNSMEIGREVFRTIKELGVKQVITECGMCRLQIHHGTGAAVYHPIQVLAEAYSPGSCIK